jgi:hypothetical protein
MSETGLSVEERARRACNCLFCQEGRPAPQEAGYCRLHRFIAELRAYGSARDQRIEELEQRHVTQANNVRVFREMHEQDYFDHKALKAEVQRLREALSSTLSAIPGGPDSHVPGADRKTHCALDWCGGRMPCDWRLIADIARGVLAAHPEPRG